MRLFTHNILQCHVKGCTENNFPLRIENAEVRDLSATEETAVEFNRDFLLNFMHKLDFDALKTTINQVNTDKSC